MVPCHHFAEQALNILRYLAKRWNINVEIKTSAKEESAPEKKSIDRSTRPVTSSLNFFSPNFEQGDFACSWGGGTDSSAAAKTSAHANTENVAQVAHAVENPLFWPFPMQGRPLLPVGKELVEAGFKPL
jgi:hypothetical protein